MKMKNIIILGILLLVGLSSCSSDDKLENGSSSKMGTLLLQIDVNSKTNVVTPGVGARAVVDTDNFYVAIYQVSSDGDKLVKEYKTYSEVEKEIRLEVGNYKVVAHSPGEMAIKMDEAYYAGESTLPIKEGVTSPTTVTCTMKNIPIDVKYNADFLTAFTTWLVTINDGKNNILSFTQADRSPKTIYWGIGEDVTEIKVDVVAYTSEGKTATNSFVCTKKSADAGSDSSATDFFVGGDNLQLNFTFDDAGEVPPTPPTPPVDEVVPGAQIGLDVNWSWESSDDDTSYIKVNPVGGTNPPTDDNDDDNNNNNNNNNNGPILTCSAFETGIEYSMEEGNWPATNVIISTPEGLNSLKVTIIAGNEGFSGIVEDMGFTDRELVGDTELSGLLGSLGVELPMPEANSLEYQFPVGTFYPMMNIYGPTVDADEEDYEPDGKEFHLFRITVTDNKGTSVTKELKVTIRK